MSFDGDLHEAQVQARQSQGATEALGSREEGEEPEDEVDRGITAQAQALTT